MMRVIVTTTLLLAFLGLPVESQADTYEGYRNFLNISPNNPYLPLLCLAGVMLAIATFFKPRLGLVVILFFIMMSTDMPVGRSAGLGRTITIPLTPWRKVGRVIVWL